MCKDRVQPRRGMLGVLGGMGPAATADFYRKLIEATPAARDQDHIPVVVVADPRIADRSQAIERGAESDVFAGMLERLRYLEAVGVDAIAMPCNTAHFWLPRLRKETTIPFISLVQAATQDARRRHPSGSTALILGTSATIKSRIYDADLGRTGFSVVLPTQKQQELVNQVIALVKAGELDPAATIFEESATSWRAQADVVLLACTELPLAAGRILRAHPTFIDTTAALVSACVAWARSVERHAVEPL